MTEQPSGALPPEEPADWGLPASGSSIEAIEARLRRLEATDELKLECAQDIEALEERLRRLEAGIPNSLPNTRLLSRSFLSRAFAVFGLNLVASLIIYAILILLYVVATLLLLLLLGLS